MNLKRLLLGLVFFDFSALSAYAVYRHGIVEFFELATANVATITLFADLTISLSLIAIWMWRDARERGTSAVPYLVLTAALGSVGPLLYLLLRRDEASLPAARLAAQPR